MRYPTTHKEETRKKLLANARAIAKKGGFGTTGVDELMASIRLTGGYHEMGKFASGIAALPRIVTLHEVEIVPTPSASGNLTLNVTAKTYRYMDEEEQSPAGANGKKKPGAG